MVAAFNLLGSGWDAKRRAYAFLGDAAATVATDVIGGRVLGSWWAAAGRRRSAAAAAARAAPVDGAAGAFAAGPGVGGKKKRHGLRAAGTVGPRDAWPALAPSSRLKSSASGPGGPSGGGLAGGGAARVAAWRHAAQELTVLAGKQGRGEEAAPAALAVDLGPLEAEVVTLAPVQVLRLAQAPAPDDHGSAELLLAQRGQKEDQKEHHEVGAAKAWAVAEVVEWAPVGLANMVNAGGAIVAQHPLAPAPSADGGGAHGGGASAEVTCMGPGRFLAYASRRPDAVAVAVTTTGNDPSTLTRLVDPPLALALPDDVTFDATTGALVVRLRAIGHHTIAVAWGGAAAATVVGAVPAVGPGEGKPVGGAGAAVAAVAGEPTPSATAPPQRIALIVAAAEQGHPDFTGEEPPAAAPLTRRRDPITMAAQFLGPRRHTAAVHVTAAVPLREPGRVLSPEAAAPIPSLGPPAPATPQPPPAPATAAAGAAHPWSDHVAALFLGSLRPSRPAAAPPSEPATAPLSDPQGQPPADSNAVVLETARPASIEPPSMLVEAGVPRWPFMPPHWPSLNSGARSTGPKPPRLKERKRLAPPRPEPPPKPENWDAMTRTAQRKWFKMRDRSGFRGMPWV